MKARLMRTASKGFPSSSTAIDPATGVPYTSYYDIFTVGAGYLDLQAALADSTGFSGTAQSPVAAYNTATDTGGLQFFSGCGFSATNLTWGENIIWGVNGFSGTNIIWGVNIVWGTNIIWGVNADGTKGFNIVWGDRAVWGTNSAPAGEAVSVTINGEK